MGVNDQMQREVSGDTESTNGAKLLLHAVQDLPQMSLSQSWRGRVLETMIYLSESH